MNLGEAKQKVISIINSKSTNGTIISNQNNADYLMRMNDLFNNPVNELSKITKIDGVYSFTQVADSSVVVKKYALPSDYKEFNRIILTTASSYTPFFIDYMWEEPKTLVIPSRYDGDFAVKYWKKPTPFPTATAINTADSQVFEIPDEAVEVACFKVAGLIMADENADVSNKCLVEYQNGKRELTPTHNPAPQGTIDVYGGIPNF